MVSKGPGWTYSYDFGDLKVRLLGLNSALLASDDADQGQLRLGLTLLGKYFLQADVTADELVIVLTHHPLRGRWLADEKEVDNWVQRYAHVHLSGHIHEADSQYSQTGGNGNLIRVSAGAAYHGKSPAGVPSSHGYNLAAVIKKPDGTQVLRVWHRRWSDKNKDFRIDSDNIPDGQLYAEHALPSKQLHAYK